MTTLNCVSAREHVGAEGAPKWNTVLPFGKAWHPSAPGEFLDVTPALVAKIVANWKAAGGNGVQVNYFHRGASSADGVPIDDKVAGAWMEDFRAGAQGLEALMRYTKRAREYLAADEIRYFSIELELDGVDLKSGKRVGPRISGGALLNDPHFTNLPRLAAAAPPANPPTTEKKHMDKKTLCAAFGLAETATDQEIVAATNAALTSAGVAHGAPSEPGDLKASIASAVQPLQGAITQLQVDLAASRARETALAADVAAGKAERHEAIVNATLVELEPHYVAAHRDMAKSTLLSFANLDDGKKLIASWPKVRPAKGELGHGRPGNIGLPDGGNVLTATQAVSKIDALVDERVKATNSSRSVARDFIMKSHPELCR